MVLRAIVDEKDDPDFRTGARSLLQKASSSLEMCHVVVGETFATLALDKERNADDCSEAMRVFHRLLEAESLQICGLKNHKETHILAKMLHEEDSMLEPNDGLILANALVCDNCGSFHTADPTVLTSKTLGAIAAEYSTKIVPFVIPDTNKRRRKTY